MKRNWPPAKEHPSQKEEQSIIEERLEELFSHSDDNLRQVSINSKGIYVKEHGHVRVDNLKGLPRELLYHSKELQYYYLDNYGALLCLESGQVAIYYNGLPLSLAEAYHLLLIDQADFKRYCVFQRLNRTGYICLKHINNFENNPTKSINDDKKNDSMADDTQINTNPIDSIFNIDAIDIPFNEVLSRLRDLGPQDEQPKDYLSNRYDIIYDVYEREKYSKTKPQKDAPGKPDFLLIVCDDISNDFKNKLNVMGKRFKGQHEASYVDGERLLYALIDEENTICFVRFSSESSHELVLLQT